MAKSLGCRPNMIVNPSYQIELVSVGFYWKYEAWHYIVVTAHDFCWLILDIFLLNLIVHSILLISSSGLMVQVRNREHLRNSTNCRALPFFRSFCTWSPFLQIWVTWIREVDPFFSFVTIYNFECVLSDIKYIKSKYRNRLYDSTFENMIRLSTTNIDVDRKEIVNQKLRTHCSY